MRYLVALLVSAVLVATLWMWMDRMGRSLKEKMRQNLIAAKERGEIPADVDLDRDDYTDFGMELSAADMNLVSILDIWFQYRIVLIPLIILSSLLIARSTERQVAKANSPAAGQS